jgi:hypothetical protein
LDKVFVTINGQILLIGILFQEEMFRGTDTGQDPGLALLVVIGTDTDIDLARGSRQLRKACAMPKMASGGPISTLLRKEEDMVEAVEAVVELRSM